MVSPFACLQATCLPMRASKRLRRIGMESVVGVEERTSWLERAWPALLAALFVVVVFAWIAGRSTLWDRDEARFAEASAELLRNHAWLVPTFVGRPRPENPILIYW